MTLPLPLPLRRIPPSPIVGVCQWRCGVPNHRFEYAIGGGDSLHCAAQSCEDILFFEAAAIEWQVTYPINFPPVCDGDLAIEIIDAPSFASHEWLTTPFQTQRQVTKQPCLLQRLQCKQR